MNFTRFGSSKGFTLTEILIVVVVIAVMASLVIPRFTGQTDKAAAAEAIGIMGAIHRALLQFNDENGAYPANNLQNITDITNTLGIDVSTVRFGWEFSTSGGTVTGTRGGFGTLILAEDGTWGGTERYAPDGDLWPHLPH